MTSKIKNNRSLPTGGQRGPASTRQGGFLEIIIIVIVALLIMKYFGLTISGAIDWFTSFFRSVLR